MSTAPATEVEGGFGAVSAALLLGGASSRMGSDKARLEVGGEPLATRIARLLDPLFAELLLVGGEAPADAPGRRVPDPPGPQCALRGLVGALEAATAGRVLVVATDLIGITPDLVLALLAWPGADAVMPRTEAGPQPLCAVYQREPALRVARARLAGERLAVQGILEELEVSFLEGADLRAVDPDGNALLNVNTPSELADARERLGAT